MYVHRISLSLHTRYSVTRIVLYLYTYKSRKYRVKWLAWRGPFRWRYGFSGIRIGLYYCRIIHLTSFTSKITYVDPQIRIHIHTASFIVSHHSHGPSDVFSIQSIKAETHIFNVVFRLCSPGNPKIEIFRRRCMYVLYYMYVHSTAVRFYFDFLESLNVSFLSLIRVRFHI